LTAKTKNDRQRIQKQTSKLNLQRKQPTKRLSTANHSRLNWHTSKASFSWLCKPDPKHAVQTGCFEQPKPAALGFVF